MARRYQGGYFLVGPYFAQNVKYQLEEMSPKGWLKTAFDNLKNQGIVCHCGRWLIEGEPQVILVDFSALWPNVNRYKRELWDDYRVDSMDSGFEFDEPAVWGYAVGRLIEQAALANSAKKRWSIAMNGWRAPALLSSPKNSAPRPFGVHHARDDFGAQSGVCRPGVLCRH